MKKTTLLAVLSFVTLSVYSQAGLTNANGIAIAYESLGNVDDPAIILIPGAGASLVSWPLELCQRLTRGGFRVIRFDNRDTGRSTALDSLGQPDWAALGPFMKTCDKAPLPYTIVDMANDVVGLMDGLNITKAHIAGASMGGTIAQMMAINFPNRVSTLTTIAASSGDPNLPGPTPLASHTMSTPPPTSTDNETLVRYLLNYYRSMGSIDADVVLRERATSHIDRGWNPAGTERQLAAMKIADNCDRRKELQKIQVPTIVIHGDVDPLVSPEAANQIAGAITGSELYMINGMGHDLSSRFIVPISNLILRNARKQAASQTMK
ncbi:MAG TPA: alpha/beta hydrolase [Chryseolinea sp.]